MKWFWRHDGKANPDTSFKTVFQTRYITEFLGTLPILKGTGAKHHLFCCRITPLQWETLLAEGFRAFGKGEHPTHAIFCVCSLAKDQGAPRGLFNFYLDFSNFPESWQTWASVKLTQELKEELIESTWNGYLIRCNHTREYPFCLEDWDIDEYWASTASRRLKWILRELESRNLNRGVIEREEADRVC